MSSLDVEEALANRDQDGHGHEQPHVLTLPRREAPRQEGADRTQQQYAGPPDAIDRLCQRRVVPSPLRREPPEEDEPPRDAYGRRARIGEDGIERGLTEDPIARELIGRADPCMELRGSGDEKWTALGIGRGSGGVRIVSKPKDKAGAAARESESMQ